MSSKKDTAFVFGPLLSVMILGAGCGYHVGGKADLVPKNVQTVAIPAFKGGSTRYKLSDKMPQALSREFIQRTRFSVVDNPGLADAVLNGSINNVYVYPTIYDPKGGRSTVVQVGVDLSVDLLEKKTGKVLFSRKRFSVISNNEIALDPHQFFDESEPALERISRDAARAIVSAVLENF